jgi:ribonucleoside-diphosphate reductase alpha chain
MKQVKKRNGTIDDFSEDKIVHAIQKAFAAQNTSIKEEEVVHMMETISAEIEATFPEQTPSVERIQDIVELAIMDAGYHAVAKAYIIYRYEHAKIRRGAKTLYC